MSLRFRLWLSFAPLLLLLAGLGGGFIYALGRVGGRIDAILRENYRSVEAMAGLNEAAEQIDSSFQFALAGKPDARGPYDANWAEYRRHLEFEQANLTEPGERELVDDLAGLTETESAFGCNMGPSSAGALGWTQFLPGTWDMYGMDADGDGKASPFNSVDAVFAAARYLRASGAPGNWRKALFAYNHSTAYVNTVLARSKKY